MLPGSDEDNALGVVQWKGDRANREVHKNVKSFTDGARQILQMYFVASKFVPYLSSVPNSGPDLIHIF